MAEQGNDPSTPGAQASASVADALVNRRSLLGMVGLGAGTLAVTGAAGLTWRAVDGGVFATGSGPAYAA